MHPDQFHETGIAVQAETIRATARLFDEATLAAMEGIREAEKRLLEGTLEQADAEAMFDAATAAARHAPGLVTLLAVLDALPVTARQCAAASATGKWVMDSLGSRLQLSAPRVAGFWHRRRLQRHRHLLGGAR